MRLFTRLTGRAESGQVVDAQYSSHMSVATVRSVSTEPAVIPRTVFYLGLGVYMQEGALLVVTSVEPGVEIAFGHFRHVVLVKELALIPLLTQTSEPVLTNYCFIPSDVSERTGSCFRTIWSHIKVTDSCPWFVHPRKRKGLCSNLITESELNIKCNMFHGCN